MSDRDTTVEERLRAELRRAPDEVLAVYLFGSRARGTARADSDVDLGLLLAYIPEPSLTGLAATLADALDAQLGLEVDVVVLNTAAPDLTHRVFRDGVLLLDRDRGARIRFEVQARNAYLDLAPLRRLYRRFPA